MKGKSVLFLFFFYLAGSLSAAVWYVDSDVAPGGDGKSWPTAFNSISAAIAAASPLYMICYAPSDQIWVKSGTYNLTSELTLNKVVVMYGGFPNGMASPTLDDRNPAVYPTIINGSNSVRCMKITSYSIIDGFIFQNGLASSGGALYIESPTYSCLGFDFSTTLQNCRFLNNVATVVGGAVYDLRSNLVIKECLFQDNSADNGGAIWQLQTNSRIEKCIFKSNSSTAGGFGGGAILGDYQTYGSIINCLFVSNSSASYGGAISYHQAWPSIINCTFADNTAAYAAGGGALYTNTSSPTLRNCIFWGNSPNQIVDYYSSPGPTASYCDIQGGFAGTGNINANPLFTGSGDYHLTASSPCIDAGSDFDAPAEDLDGKPRPLDGNGDSIAAIDMGAYEFEYINVDLRITSISLNPKVPHVGQPVAVTVTIHNAGTTNAGSFYLDWYADRASLPSPGTVGDRWKRFSSLAAGASDAMTVTYTYATEGIKRMYAQVDTEGEVEETYETNNIYGPLTTWAMIGVLLDFNVIHDQHNAVIWFGGDDRVDKRNVGVGQSITLTRPANVTSAGFRFDDPFDYYTNPEGHGHAVYLIMYARKADGSILAPSVKLVPSNFTGGWVMMPFSNLWLEPNQTYIFTCYLYQGEYNEFTSGVCGRWDNPWPSSTGYAANVSGQPANMELWSNWNTHPWDFNLQLTGQYVERYPGDINDDRSVNLGDLSVVADNWMVSDCIMPNWCENSDINWNSRVKLEDFSVISRFWRAVYHDYDALNRAAVVTLESQMSTASIYGSDGMEFNPGTYFVYKTSAGRYGKFIVEQLTPSENHKLTLGWVTYNADGTVYSSGTGLIVRGTYNCDLDVGLETSVGADFQWVQATSTVRYLYPKNGAKFKLMYRAP
ncbi:MAG: right-handed parallel beta-helix repeat-containing protein [Phycisphaerae bacterium]|nr:right-handed parallel beta-helix repeat-containing protein [Phycisphaerae bacterium]